MLGDVNFSMHFFRLLGQNMAHTSVRRLQPWQRTRTPQHASACIRPLECRVPPFAKAMRAFDHSAKVLGPRVAQELYKQMTWDAATHSSAFAAPSMTTPLLSPPPSPKPEPANGSSESDGACTLMQHRGVLQHRLSRAPGMLRI